ncbi:MAG: undecaprenyl-diphosphate phosphatase [Bacteroidales bacterium]|nr:undecaprenyl-diphosphate phosphatase [Bacteroidales bacterium]
MNNWEALILGLVQGLTEFLPVSSSGHLMIGRNLLGVEVTEDLMFEVVVHAATVLSTIVVFRHQIFSILKEFFRFRYNDGMDYVLKIALSMLPVFVVGVFFKDYVTELFTSMTVVGSALLVTALLLLLSDNFDALKARFSCKKRATSSAASAASAGCAAASSASAGCAAVETPASTSAPRNGLSYAQAFVVGLSQAIAVLPGLSRSGTTISVGLLSGVPRAVVAQFSFLMVLVPILGESFLGLVGGEMASSQVGVSALIVGFCAAFISGLFACKVMIALVKRARLSWFALYCAIVGALTLIFLQ